MKNEIGESNNTENGKNNMKVTPPNTVSSPGPQSSEEKPSHNLRLTVIHSEHSPSVSEDKRDENNAIYVLEIEDCSSSTPISWQIYRHYNQFQEFHQNLKEKPSCSFIEMVPPRKWFTRYNSAFMERRLKQLQEYFDTLLASNISRNELLEFFNPALNTTNNIPSEMWGKPDKIGLLTKQGHIVKSWKPRWFVLKNHNLFYFKEKPTKDSIPLGVIPVDFCIVEVVSNQPKKWIFQITNTFWNTDEKDYLIQATSEEEMNDWIQSIRQAKESEVEEKPVGSEDLKNKRIRSYAESTQKTGVMMITSHFDLREFAEKEKLSKVTALTKDSPDNILYHPPEEEKLINIKGATIEKLIEKLITLEDGPNKKTSAMMYILAFLLTYRSFTTPNYLLGKLIEYFKWCTGEKKHPSGIHPIQFRVCFILKKWIDVHFYDFLEDMELTQRLFGFIDAYLKTNSSLQTTGQGLRSVLLRKLEPEKIDLEYQLQGAPKPILPSAFTASFDVIDIDPIEIARQLTIFEHALFKNMHPKEFLHQKWNKPDKEIQAPNICKVIKKFNQTSFWVVSCIVSKTNLKVRSVLLKRFIEIASQCYKLNNFNSMQAIIAGISSSSIYRLKKTFEALPLETQTLQEQIKEIMSSDKNYKNYRKYLQEVARDPCVPYLGVYLSDLTFIEDGNPDILKDTKLVNFEKRAMISKVITEIQAFQNIDYCLRPVPEIQNFLAKMEILSEKDAYDRSLQCEPREQT